MIRHIMIYTHCMAKLIIWFRVVMCNVIDILIIIKIIVINVTIHTVTEFLNKDNGNVVYFGLWAKRRM